ncbi:hypothetical protein F511_28054 [Dorcoceras hygrometricum]|uniref:Uncharacterized protein n=1 Tax=Dorcoceras hygrometricum TaxID=472368 RepID=A0A2Z7BIH0_9LAMI|nr:hypothetical protein F511_28054 [Dorcoceras hygrometricum]
MVGRRLRWRAATAAWEGEERKEELYAEEHLVQELIIILKINSQNHLHTLLLLLYPFLMLLLSSPSDITSPFNVSNYFGEMGAEGGEERINSDNDCYASSCSIILDEAISEERSALSLSLRRNKSKCCIHCLLARSSCDVCRFEGIGFSVDNFGYSNMRKNRPDVNFWSLSGGLEKAPGSEQFHEEIGTSTVGGFGLLIRSTTGIPIPSSVCTRKLDEDFTDGISSSERSGGGRRLRWRAATAAWEGEERKEELYAEEHLAPGDNWFQSKGRNKISDGGRRAAASVAGGDGGVGRRGEEGRIIC